MQTTWTVLVIDDSAADRTLYRRYLTRDPHQQYTLLEASSGAQGLACYSELAQDKPVDVILLDFALPDMTGLQFLQQLPDHYPQTAIIMLTAYGDEEVAVSALKGGAQDYLLKDGLQPDRLQHTVRNVIAQAQLRQQVIKTQERQRLLTQIAFQIRQSLELQQTLNTAVTEVRNLLQCDRVLAYQFATDMSGTIIAESVQAGYPATLGQTITDTYFQHQGAQDYCAGRSQIVSNIHTADLNPCHRNLLAQFAVQASLVTPILVQVKPENRNQLWGLLVAHQCSMPRAWQTDEVHTLHELAIHLAIAIQHAELLAKTQTALKKEQALSAFKSQIITTVSHEYNAPLTAIQTAAETLQTHYQNLDLAKQERLLAIIEQKSKHMAGLVKNMLLVNQAELDELQIAQAPIHLGQLLTYLLTEHQITAAERHHLALSTQGHLEGVVGDRSLLQQVFNNLISNAIKYSPDGGKIEIQLIGEAKQVVCHISDEGIGIPRAEQRLIFQTFSRGSNVGAIEGTGLGLHIAKIAVALHGGTIDVMSQEGHSSQFTVCLPKTEPA
ncbi:MAG: response regulator [Spirulina sp. SIO3F2]|nr:response regulator [Spirulina sp. SIO3F2]